MQQCLMVIHDDAHDQILVTFNIWDVTRRDRVDEILTQILQITNNNKTSKGNEDRKYQ
jgi:hypothetical protein